VKVFLAVVVLVVLLAARIGQTANPAPGAPAAAPAIAHHAEEPDPSAMVLACLGLIVYLARRRSKALAGGA
jgi:hypothetical protein